MVTGIETFVAEHGWPTLLAAAAGLALGGFAKGVVGFALPLIGLGVLGSILPLEAAVALLIMPTLVTNLFQSLRDGLAEALGSVRAHWRLYAILVVTIALAAQLVVVLPAAWLLGALGLFITALALVQIVGWRPRIPSGGHRPAELGTALVAGFFGGIGGIWGPPIIFYLLARELPKAELIRVQCIAFMAGSVVLVVAHLGSGVLNAVTFPVSLAMVVPTLAAMFLGYRVQDRLNPQLFRILTLAILLLAGLNLLRRALTG